jgi:galactokinase
MSNQSLLNEAIHLFQEKFHENPIYAVFAPGRANLIGEHTDYNNGFVLPFALPYKTIIVAAKSKTNECIVYSTERSNEILSFRIDEHLSKGTPTWGNYVKGTIFQYLQDIPEGFAFNAVITSTVPVGSGLSSSAALV